MTQRGPPWDGSAGDPGSGYSRADPLYACVPTLQRVQTRLGSVRRPSLPRAGAEKHGKRTSPDGENVQKAMHVVLQSDVRPWPVVVRVSTGRVGPAGPYPSCRLGRTFWTPGSCLTAFSAPVTTKAGCTRAWKRPCHDVAGEGEGSAIAASAWRKPVVSPGDSTGQRRSSVGQARAGGASENKKSGQRLRSTGVHSCLDFGALAERR